MRYQFLLGASILAVALQSHAGKGGIGAAFGALIGSAGGNAIGSAAGPKMSVEEALGKVSNQINSRLPMTVDRDTRWDSSLAGPGRSITY